MMTIEYSNNLYTAQAGVTIKTVIMDHDPGRPSKTYAIGQDKTEYFECTFDSFGNICDADGIVVFPSRSGAHPLERGDRGYFGKFVENFAMDRNTDSLNAATLPSITNAITVKAARKAAKLTQKELADAAGINIRQIQRIETGEASIGNVTLANAVKLADALGVDVRDLI